MFAIAEFGSTVRRDADANSDKDLLIVGQGLAVSKARNEYCALGYSVSTYSPRQLECMRKAGSLFLQHLRYESRISIDSKSMFAKFLETCEFRAPDSAEVKTCAESLISALSSPPELAVYFWKCDFLYCITRDFLIKLLARNGIVRFGLDGIERECARLWGVPKKQFQIMRELRSRKAAYRAGNPTVSDHTEGLEKQLFRMVCRVYPLGEKPPRPKTFLILVDRAIKCGTSYEKLRILEGAYKVLTAGGFRHPEHREIELLITRPNYSKSTARFRLFELTRYLRDVRNELTTNSVPNRTLDRGPPSLPFRSRAG